MSLTDSGRKAVSAYEVVHASREFRTLRRRFLSYVTPVTLAFLAWYFIFVITAAFAPGFMSTRVIGSINIGLCFGAFQFVSTFAITLGYSRWARRNIDPASTRIRQRLERGRQQ